MAPTPPATANLAAFLSIKKKASSAEAQKFLLVMATKVKAFLLMNLMNLSKQATKHMQQEMAYLTTEFSEDPDYLQT